MGEDDTNLVLPLLRDIRSDTSDTRLRLGKVERRLDELHEGMIQAIGMAGLATVATERNGEGMDEIRDQLEAPRRRVADLEARV